METDCPILAEFGRVTNAAQLYNWPTDVGDSWCCNLEPQLRCKGGRLVRIDLPGDDAQQIAGTVPYSFGGLSELTYLNFADNALNGSLDFFTNLTKLETVNLENNLFTGTAEALIFSSEVVDIDISGNMLSGSLNYFFRRNFSNLTYLDASDNVFSGDIWNLTVFRLPPQLASLDISSNQLDRQVQHAFIDKATERPFLFRATGNSFVCPYPEFGPNVVFDRDPCTHSLVLFEVVAGACLLGYATWHYYSSLEIDVRKNIWMVESVARLALLIAFLMFSMEMLDFLNNNELAPHCRGLEFRALFHPALPPTAPPVPSTVDTFASYIDYLRSASASETLIEECLAAFGDLCASVNSCVVMAETPTTCVPSATAGDIHVYNAGFRNFLMAFLWILAAKESARLYLVTRVYQTKKVPKNTGRFLARSPLAWFLFRRASTAAVLCRK